MNAVIYARYSSHSQTEQSIEGQLRDNYEFCKQQNYTVVGEYIDRARSGTTDSRADFKRMIADAAKKQFEVIIVWKLDRFARNRYDSAIYKARLKKYGVRVVSCKENISDNPEGIILEGMLEAMAEYYSANLSVNVKRGLRETLSKGNFAGGSIPYGYNVVNGKLVPNERTAPVVKYMFEQYASGVNKKKIFDELTRRGVTSPSGRKLTITSFQRAFRNRTYIGEFMVHGKIIEGCATPIIDKEVFEKVQNRLNDVARAPAAAKAQVDYALQGKAFCGLCKSNLVGECGRGKMGAVYHYYACAKKKKLRACTKKNERKDDLEYYVVDKTVNYVLSPDNIVKISKAVAAEYEKEFCSSAIPDMERSLSRMEADLNKLVDALVEAPKSAHKRIYEKMESIEAQKAELEVDIVRQRIAYEARYTEEDVAAWLKQFCDGDVNDESFRRRIIDVFINKVFVYDDKTVILYNTRASSAGTPSSALASSELKSSDLELSIPLKDFKSEPAFMLRCCVFGYLFLRC